MKSEKWSQLNLQKESRNIDSKLLVSGEISAKARLTFHVATVASLRVWSTPELPTTPNDLLLATVWTFEMPAIAVWFTSNYVMPSV
jgi:hypothetical protein